MDEIRVSVDKIHDLRMGFCPLCEDTNGNGGPPVRRDRVLGGWYCPNCDTLIYTADDRIRCAHGDRRVRSA